MSVDSQNRALVIGCDVGQSNNGDYDSRMRLPPDRSFENSLETWRDLTDQERSIFSSMLLQTARSLFAGDGRSWAPWYEGTSLFDNELVASSTGFANGEGVRGNLVIMALPDFFVSVYPEELRNKALSDSLVADWAAELGNQLLGRIKNQVRSRGLSLNMGIPTVFSGNQLKRFGNPQFKTIRECVKVGGQEVILLLEVGRRGDAPIFSEAADSAESAAEEGDVLLF